MDFTITYYKCICNVNVKKRARVFLLSWILYLVSTMTLMEPKQFNITVMMSRNNPKAYIISCCNNTTRTVSCQSAENLFKDLDSTINLSWVLFITKLILCKDVINEQSRKHIFFLNLSFHRFWSIQWNDFSGSQNT